MHWSRVSLLLGILSLPMLCAAPCAVCPVPIPLTGLGFRAGFQACTARFGLGALGYALVLWSFLWNVSGVPAVS